MTPQLNYSATISLAIPKWQKFLYLGELYWLFTIIIFRLRRNELKQAISEATFVKPTKKVPSETETEAFVNLTKSLTQQVYRTYILPNSCLHQALLPCWFLARRGIKAKLNISVRKYPFSAHAWAEWEDIMLSDKLPLGMNPNAYVSILKH